MDGQYTRKIRQNYNSLDVLKVALAIIIILRHCSQSFFDVGSAFNIIVTNTLSPLGVPTFFVISGFLFFRKKQEISDWVRYVSRVAKLYLVWTVIYLPLIFWNMKNAGSFDIIGLIQRILFEGSYYHLWFLPSLIVAITLVYFLSKKLNDQIIGLLCLGFYIIGTLVNSYSFLSVYLSWGGYKAIFLTTRNGLFFGMLFIFIGKMIAQGYKPRKWVGIIGVIILCVEGWYLSVVHQAPIVNMSLVSVLLVPVIVTTAIKTPDRFASVNGKFWRSVSTILFCIHPYVIFVIGVVGRKVGLPSSVLVITIVGASLIGSIVIVKLSEKITVLKHLV